MICYDGIEASEVFDVNKRDKSIELLFFTVAILQVKDVSIKPFPAMGFMVY